MEKKFLVLILIAFAWGCSQNTDSSDAYGNFESEPVIVSSEATGKVVSFIPEQGMNLEPGVVTAIIDTTQTVLKKQQLQAQKAAVGAKRSSIQSQVAVFQEQIKNLKVNENRIRQMLNDKAATQKQLDDLTGQISVIEKQIEGTKTQFTSINKEIDVLNAQEAEVEEQLRRCYVTNPINGTVLEKYVEQDEFATTGKPLYKIANINELTLKVYVSGAMLPSVKIGQQVTVVIDKDKTENQDLTGTVTWISQEAEFTPKIIQTKEERVKLVYAVKVNVKNDGRLKIGMPGEVKF